MSHDAEWGAPRSLTFQVRGDDIFAGPSGSGKTFLVELLFRDVLRLPMVIVDATQYSETGYVGEDVATILTRLLLTAGQDVAWTACGVFCIELPLYQQSFEREGVALEFDESYLDKLTKDAFRLKTGARGLRAALGTALEAAAYECFGDPSRGYRVRLGWDGDEVVIRTSAARQSIPCPPEYTLLPRDEELQAVIDEIMSEPP